MKSIVWNERDRNKPSNAIYVGRPTKWGNPFKIGPDGTRKQVIQKYLDWINSNPFLLGQLKELRNRDLSCWCSPLPCHAEILIELANKD